MAMTSTVQGPKPGSAASSVRASLQSAPSSSRRDPSASAATSVVRVVQPAAWQGQRLRVETGQRLGGREEVGQTAFRVLHRNPVGTDQPGRVGAGGGCGDLLAEHRAYGELRRVDRARHPAAGAGVDQRGEQRIRAQLVVHGDRVGVQVEESAAAADGLGEVAGVGQGEPASRCGRAAG